jgi:hypothetical protein
LGQVLQFTRKRRLWLPGARSLARRRNGGRRWHGWLSAIRARSSLAAPLPIATPSESSNRRCPSFPDGPDWRGWRIQVTDESRRQVLSVLFHAPSRCAAPGLTQTCLPTNVPDLTALFGEEAKPDGARNQGSTWRFAGCNGDPGTPPNGRHSHGRPFLCGICASSGLCCWSAGWRSWPSCRCGRSGLLSGTRPDSFYRRAIASLHRRQ